MTITLERWMEEKNSYKSEGNLVLDFYALASLISYAETGSVSDFLKDNLEVTIASDPRRPSIRRYRLNYKAQYNREIVSTSVNENHANNGILNDFEYEIINHEEKFRIRVK